MTIGHISGCGGMPDLLARYGMMNNYGRARIQAGQRTVKVNNAGQKEKGGTSTERNRESSTLESKGRSHPH